MKKIKVSTAVWILLFLSLGSTAHSNCLPDVGLLSGKSHSIEPCTLEGKAYLFGVDGSYSAETIIAMDEEDLDFVYGATRLYLRTRNDKFPVGQDFEHVDFYRIFSTLLIAKDEIERGNTILADEKRTIYRAYVLLQYALFGARSKDYQVSLVASMRAHTAPLGLPTAKQVDCFVKYDVLSVPYKVILDSKVFKDCIGN